MAVAQIGSSLVGFVWSVTRYKDYVDVSLYRPGSGDSITLKLLPQEAADLGEVISKRAAEQ